MSSTNPQSVYRIDLGQQPYQPIWDLQRSVQQTLIEQKRKVQREGATSKPLPDVLLMVEHPHVFTLGKSGLEENLLKSPAQLQQIDATYVKIDRGGDITYHGPGQLVVYPILDMDRHFTDIHKYLRLLEEVIIHVCADYGIEAGRSEGLTGVWVGSEKICAMGVKCSRWVTMHGLAFNVSTDLSYFNHIVPCGIQEKGVTSLEQLLGHHIDPDEVKQKFSNHFETAFNVRFTELGEVPDSYLTKQKL